MSSLNPLPKSQNPLAPELLDQFFSPEQQRTYVAALLGRGGLTRRRAEYFVRLWAYLLLKQSQECGHGLPQTLTKLEPLAGSVSCTHREAAELFYVHQERGSDRAAGMMIDQLTALGLLEKRFDGQTLCLQISPLPELAALAKSPSVPVELRPDDFNPRTDAIPVANCMANTYAWMIKDQSTAPQKIVKALRSWSHQYPKGLRVMRRQDNLNPVAISILYPTASESEDYFFRSPAKSFYLSSDVQVDPIKMAEPGDQDCTSIYVRAWIVDSGYLLKPHLSEFLKDTQKTLVNIQADFPNLCDIYSPVIHPLYEELRLILGFQKTNPDHRPFYWAYISLDRFLEVDIEKAVSNLTFNSPSGNV